MDRDISTDTVDLFYFIIFFTQWIYYSAITKNEIFIFVTTWMDLEGIRLKINKSNLERQILYDFTYMWKLKAKQMKKCSRTVIDTENKCGCQRGRA